MTELRTTPQPGGSPRCERGDILACIESADAARTPLVRLYRVEDVVRLVRLVPFGESSFVDEEAILDSVPAAYTGQIYLLLRAAAGSFASLEDAERALGRGGWDASLARDLLCRRLDDLDPATMSCIPAGRTPRET